MKRSRIVISIIALCFCFGNGTNSLAQVNYRLQWITFPGATYMPTKDVNNLGIVVGLVSVSNFYSGYVYDQNGSLGGGARFYLLDDLIAIPAEIKEVYPESRIDGINELGHVVGSLRGRNIDGSFVHMGFFADLKDRNSFQALRNPTGAESFQARRINDNSDVLCRTISTSDNPSTLYLYNPLHPSTDPEILSDPVTGSEITVDSAWIGLNNSRQVVGDSENTVFRWTPGEPMETFAGLTRARDLNDEGEFTGKGLFPSTSGRGKKKENALVEAAYRYSDQLGVELISGLSGNAQGAAINNSGDVVGNYSYLTGNLFTFHDDLGELNLDNLVVSSNNADLEFWFAASNMAVEGITDRDSTGFGQIVGRVTVSTTTGKGKNRVTSTEHRAFILTPESP